MDFKTQKYKKIEILYYNDNLFLYQRHKTKSFISFLQTVCTTKCKLLLDAVLTTVQMYKR